jgi:hypothetical protein
VLGPDTEIKIEAFDECNNFVDARTIAKRIRKAGSGMVGLVGVQSNQFPRALDLGREFRALGVPVVMGGYHVSGCLAMLPKIPSYGPPPGYASPLGGPPLPGEYSPPPGPEPAPPPSK